VVTKSFASTSFTSDPIASSLKADVDHAVSLGDPEVDSLTNIFDLTLLNKFSPRRQDPGRVVTSTAGVIERPSAKLRRGTQRRSAGVRIDRVSKAYGHAATPSLRSTTCRSTWHREFVCIVGHPAAQEHAPEHRRRLDSPTRARSR